LGRRRISTSGFAYMATETAVFAVRSAKPCFSWDTCFTFLVPAHQSNPRQNSEGCKTVVVVVVLRQTDINISGWQHDFLLQEVLPFQTCTLPYCYEVQVKVPLDTK